MRRGILAMLTAGVLGALPVAIAAQTAYPSRPTRLVVPNPPGGATDTLARIIAPRLGERLGQPVIIENRPGSNGNIATEWIARAAPDGYSMLLAADAQIAISPHLYKLSFDAVRDLAPVTAIGTTRMILAVNPKLPVQTLAEFVAHAKQANPPLAYASIGSGSQHHLVMEMFKSRAGIELLHVPYKGGGPATTAVIAGDVWVMFGGNSTAPHIKSGKLRALAVATATRSPAFPEVPALAESYPGMEVTTWIGLFVPSGTPPAVVRRLYADTQAVLAEAEILERFRNAGGMEPLPLSTAAFAALVLADHAKYGSIVAVARIKAE
jgi:tripartite-type tricarboxylate transporter receptor subunit TctC